MNASSPLTLPPARILTRGHAAEMPMAPPVPEVIELTEEEIEELERLQREAEEKKQNALNALAAQFDIEFEEQASRKKGIEDRMLEDLRAYHGRYPAEVEKLIAADKKRSRVFAKLARSQTHAWEARLIDMLFPPDDKNYGIAPTPVPDLNDQYRRNAMQAQQLVGRANNLNALGDREGAIATAGEAEGFARKAQEARAVMDEAKRKAAAMELKVDDQFVESRYPVKARQALRDGCRVGTGIMKGPVKAGRVRPKWKKTTGPDGKTLWLMEQVHSSKPDWENVDVWNFFPDMSAASPAGWQFTYQRHFCNPKEFKDLALRQGFKEDLCARLLEEKPRRAMPDYFTELRSITDNADTNAPEMKYWVMERHGLVSVEHFELLANALMQPDDAAAAIEEAKRNPLRQVHAIVWYCQGVMLKIAEHPMESGETLYSVWNLEKDDTSCFGFGVPYMMRDSLAAFNAAWRMMLENGGLSAGPQIVVDQNQIEPVDGTWELTPRKVWRRIKGQSPSGPMAFEIHEIQNNQTQLAGILEIARRLIDDETNMPLIAKGEQGSHVTQTAGGMNVLMNAVNVVFKRAVRSWDDDMTTPNVRRQYDWNMMYAEDDEIKGDYQINAYGSSVLLMKEIQAANLNTIITSWTKDPVLLKLLKVAATARKAMQANMIPADDVIKSDDEIQQDEANAPPPPPPPEQIRAEAMVTTAKIAAQSREAVELIRRDTRMMETVEKMNWSREELDAYLQDSREERASSERKLAAEIGAQSVMVPKGLSKGGGGSV